MPVDPDISQSTAGGGYQPGFDPDYDPDQVSSRPKQNLDIQPPKSTKPQPKQEKFDPIEDSPVDPSDKTSNDSYSSKMARESREADKKTEQKRQASKKIAAKDSSAQDGASHRSSAEQKALDRSEQAKLATSKLPGSAGGGAMGGAGKSGMPGGAGAGKAAGIDPQKIEQGLAKAGQRAAQGDFKGAARGAIQDAATVAAEVGEGRAMLFLMAWAIPTLGLSLVIGGTALLIANMFVNKRAGTKIEIPGYQKALILALDIAWLLGIALMLIVAVASFCYALTSPSYSARLNAVLASPGSAIAGEVGRFVLPAEVGNFCSSLTGNGASTPPTRSTSGPIIAAGCKNVESGACNRLNISACPGMAAQMDSALRICNQESNGGQPFPSTTDKCFELSTKQKVSFSWGLWQINILNSASKYPECRGVLQKVEPVGRDCSVSPPYEEGPYNGADCSCRFGPGGAGAFKVCTDALIADSARNTAQACTLFNDRGPHNGIREWNPWVTSARKCKVPGY